MDELHCLAPMVMRGVILVWLLLACSALGQGFGFTFFDQPWMGRIYEDSTNDSPPTACYPTTNVTIISSFEYAIPYPVVFCVTNTALITNISLTLSNYNHNFPIDVGVALSLRTATTNWAAVGVVFDEVGGTTNGGNVALVFENGASALPQNEYFTSGTFAPTRFGSGRDMELYQRYPVFTPEYDAITINTGTNTLGFGDFVGKSPVGVWEVWVWDFTAGDGGQVDGWILTIDGGPNYAGPGAQ